MTISDIDQKLSKMRIEYKTASPAMRTYLLKEATLLKSLKADLERKEFKNGQDKLL